MTATNKNIPGKRLKTWHRAHVASAGPLSLLQFARRIVASTGTDERSKMERETAIKWAGGKVAPK